MYGIEKKNMVYLYLGGKGPQAPHHQYASDYKSPLLK